MDHGCSCLRCHVNNTCRGGYLAGFSTNANVKTEGASRADSFFRRKRTWLTLKQNIHVLFPRQSMRDRFNSEVNLVLSSHNLFQILGGKCDKLYAISLGMVNYSQNP